MCIQWLLFISSLQEQYFGSLFKSSRSSPCMVVALTSSLGKLIDGLEREGFTLPSNCADEFWTRCVVLVNGNVVVIHSIRYKSSLIVGCRGRLFGWPIRRAGHLWSLADSPRRFIYRNRRHRRCEIERDGTKDVVLFGMTFWS